MTADIPPEPPESSLWRDTGPRRRGGRRLDGDLDVEVAVVGGGIVGLTSAVLAADRGLDVALLEARQVGDGTSGATTGKFSANNGLRYQRLRRRFGRHAASAYAMAARSGIERTLRLAEEHDIRCGIEHVPSHLAVASDGLVPRLEEEAAAAADAGLRPLWGWDGDPVPVAVRAVITYRDELQLHPMAYLSGLADAIEARGAAVYEHSRVVGLARERSAWVLETDRGRVRAQHVVVATRLPAVGDRRLTFSRATPVGACGVAGHIDEPLPRGTLLLVGASTWSVRASRWPEDEQRLVVVGPDVRFPDGPRTANLVAGWATARWPGIDLTHRWFAQDQQPVDDRPLIGLLRERSVWSATGFGKWGLALGTYAAERIVAGIAGDPHAVPRFFAPQRVSARALGPFVRSNATVARRWLQGRVRPDGADAQLAPGHGRVRQVGGRPVAEAMGADGTLHRLDARCTHLGCPVSWNATSRSWDCRCHGARFAVDGSVLEAPATQPLTRLDGAEADPAPTHDPDEEDET